MPKKKKIETINIFGEEISFEGRATEKGEFLIQIGKDEICIMIEEGDTADSLQYKINTEVEKYLSYRKEKNYHIPDKILGRNKTWYAGKCKKCGSDVEECTDKISGIKDYQNRCTNTKCEEHKWHFIFDDEFLDYYINKQ